MREITSGPAHGGGDQRAAFFGMGAARQGTLRVRWPSGSLQDVGIVQRGQRLHLVEPSRITPASAPPGPSRAWCSQHSSNLTSTFAAGLWSCPT